MTPEVPEEMALLKRLEEALRLLESRTPKDFLTRPEVRDYIGGISENTLNVWKAEGLPWIPSPTGRKELYCRESVRQWLLAREEKLRF